MLPITLWHAINFTFNAISEMLLGRKTLTNLDSVLKSRDITLPTKKCSQSYIFTSSHVQIWELVHKEGRAPKNWCFWIAVLQKTLESPLDCKEIKPVNPKGTQPWIFIGGTDAEAPILWPRDMKSQFIGKDSDPGEEGRQKEKRVADDEMVRQHHWLSGHKSEKTPGDSGGQGSLACYSPWGCKELVMA